MANIANKFNGKISEYVNIFTMANMNELMNNISQLKFPIPTKDFPTKINLDMKKIPSRCVKVRFYDRKL